MNWKRISLVLSVAILLTICICKGYRLLHRPEVAYTVEVIEVSECGYGYKIIRDEQAVIVQPFVPGLPGNRFFSSADDARRVGELVLERLRSAKDFAITAADLEGLGIASPQPSPKERE